MVAHQRFVLGEWLETDGGPALVEAGGVLDRVRRKLSVGHRELAYTRPAATSGR